MNASGKPDAPLMGQGTYSGVRTLGLPVPLKSVVLNPDHAVIYIFSPHSVWRTVMEMIWLAKGTAIQGVEFDANRVAALLEPTVKEDKVLVDNARLGVEFTEYRPGPYIKSEIIVSEFDRWYLDRVAFELTRDVHST